MVLLSTNVSFWIAWLCLVAVVWYGMNNDGRRR
jgi:hypothetical protein